MPIGELVGWARAQGIPPATGATLLIPNVAPGTYQLCFNTAENGADTCRVQTLARGADVELATR